MFAIERVKTASLVGHAPGKGKHEGTAYGAQWTSWSGTRRALVSHRIVMGPRSQLRSRDIGALRQRDVHRGAVATLFLRVADDCLLAVLLRLLLRWAYGAQGAVFWRLHGSFVSPLHPLTAGG